MVPAMQSISARATPAENGVRAWAIRVVTAMTIMSALTVAVRVISRRMRRQKLWWDDWLCIVSMVSHKVHSIEDSPISEPTISITDSSFFSFVV